MDKLESSFSDLCNSIDGIGSVVNNSISVEFKDELNYVRRDCLYDIYNSINTIRLYSLCDSTLSSVLLLFIDFNLKRYIDSVVKFCYLQDIDNYSEVIKEHFNVLKQNEYESQENILQDYDEYLKNNNVILSDEFSNKSKVLKLRDFYKSKIKSRYSSHEKSLIDNLDSILILEDYNLNLEDFKFFYGISSCFEKFSMSLRLQYCKDNGFCNAMIDFLKTTCKFVLDFVNNSWSKYFDNSWLEYLDRTYLSEEEIANIKNNIYAIHVESIDDGVKVIGYDCDSKMILDMDITCDDVNLNYPNYCL